ncbi:MYOF protein, partial [Rhipidura dahli]|nr:MYOF protein [Rhipidura dahli]
QVLAWGLRGLRGAVREPRLELQWGEQRLWTPPIEDIAANPNFPSNAFVLTLALPEEERLVPPIRLRLWERADTERWLLLGQASVRGLGRYRCPPPRQEQLLGSGSPGNGSYTAVPMPGWLRWVPRSPGTSPGTAGHRHPPAPCLSFPFAPCRSCSATSGTTGLRSRGQAGHRDDPRPGPAPQIYGCELEAVPEFEGLQDFCQTFPLYKPGRPPQPGQHPEPVGSFKGLFRIYPMPEEPGVSLQPRCFQRLPSNKPQECLVRVYIVRAFDLSPRDVSGLSDPYVRVALGKKTLGQRDQYVPNTLEPVFGSAPRFPFPVPPAPHSRCSQLSPLPVPPAPHFQCPQISVPCAPSSPFPVLPAVPTPCAPSSPFPVPPAPHCRRALELLPGPRGLPAPLFNPQGTALTLNGQSFELRHFERGPPVSRHPGEPRERLALHVLNLCELVPEHLETRSLQSRAQPGLEQGKVQMWVDIFPTSLGPPGPPVNIDPRKAEGYELRCVVWNVRDTELADTNLLGQRMSDIYVAGWLDGLAEQRQQTDIHYRSRNGRGAFNWRFVFPFEFLAAEKLCAIRHKEHVWSWDETLLKELPLVTDLSSPGPFPAGILELELTRLPRPAPTARLCRAGPQELPWCSWPWCRAPVLARSPLNLFRKRRARGWWPCTMHDDSGQRLSGKLELSLELLTAQEAEERPAGKGREEPNKHPTLPEPRRPKSSFLWLQSPLSLVRHGVRWRYLLWAGLGLAALLLLLLLHSFF